MLNTRLLSYQIQTGDIEVTHLPEISPLPPNLQHLTIRTAASLSYDEDENPICCVSYLPATAEIINLFISSKPLQHLVLDINISLFALPDLNKVDFFAT